MIHFHRETLANELARAVMGLSPLSDAPNGLFLTAPRRTGKSSFLLQDLAPALRAKGAFVVYVDLWEDLQRDPADLIAEKLEKELLAFGGALVRIARSLKNEGVGKIEGLVNLNAEGPTLTLKEALETLGQKSKCQVALIVDEAQQALTTRDGMSMMTALKSARDQLKGSGRPLRLVFSGSDRDKLLRLVNTRQAPFYGSTPTTFPKLDRSFVEFVVEKLQAEYPRRCTGQSVDKLWEAFQLFGQQPQFFVNAIEQAVSPLRADDGQRVDDLVLQAAKEYIQGEENQMESTFKALQPLEQLVIWRILAKGEKFKPYDAEALQFYADQGGEAVTQQQIQNALNQLRNMEPPLVWRSLYGEYTIEDTGWARWYENAQAAGQWPPADALKPVKPRRVRKPKA